VRVILISLQLYSYEPRTPHNLQGTWWNS